MPAGLYQRSIIPLVFVNETAECRKDQNGNTEEATQSLMGKKRKRDDKNKRKRQQKENKSGYVFWPNASKLKRRKWMRDLHEKSQFDSTHK